MEGGKDRKKSMTMGIFRHIMEYFLARNRVESLQQKILAQLHEGHQGIHKSKERARISVWWTGITQNIILYLYSQFQQPKVELLILSTCQIFLSRKLQQTCLSEISQSTSH